MTARIIQFDEPPRVIGEHRGFILVRHRGRTLNALAPEGVTLAEVRAARVGGRLRFHPRAWGFELEVEARRAGTF
jgi:hypothetical protein